MKFNQLLERLRKNTFEEIIVSYNECSSDDIPVECIKNEVYEDEDLYEFLKELGAEIIGYDGVGYVLIMTDNNEYYELPYEDRTNRFGDDLPDETVLFFDIDKIYDVTESYCY